MKLSSRIRNGSAAVEMAICVPFVMLLVFGAVELSGGLYHQHAIRVAAHEGAIAASDASATGERVLEAVEDILLQRSISDFEIQLEVVNRTFNTADVEYASTQSFTIPSSGVIPEGVGDIPRGNIVRLNIVASRPSIAGVGASQQFLDTTISAECVFVKE